MRFGAHLPLIDFQGRGWRGDNLASFVDAARDAGFDAIAANDHLLYPRPWLDGIVALSSVIERSGSMELVTTVVLPVLRGPLWLAKAAVAIDLLSDGRLILGVGAGSSQRDYQAVGLQWEERWRLLDRTLPALRDQLREDPRTYLRAHYGIDAVRLEPRPRRTDGPPLWVGAWGSDAGLRRVARFGDGWLASAYNTTPQRFAAGRKRLFTLIESAGRSTAGFPCAVSTFWTYVTDDASARSKVLAQLASVVNRPPAELAEQVLIGPPEACAQKLRAFAEAGADYAFIWPVRDEAEQLQRFMSDVAPLVSS